MCSSKKRSKNFRKDLYGLKKWFLHGNHEFGCVWLSWFLYGFPMISPYKSSAMIPPSNGIMNATIQMCYCVWLLYIFACMCDGFSHIILLYIFIDLMQYANPRIWLIWVVILQKCVWYLCHLHLHTYTAYTVPLPKKTLILLTSQRDRWRTPTWSVCTLSLTLAAAMMAEPRLQFSLPRFTW